MGQTEMIVRSAKEMGALIRDRRTGLGLSQLQLAEKVGVSRVWIVQFEAGKPTAQLGLVLRTLRELGVSLDAVLNEDSSPFPIDLGAIIDRTLE